jgi:hypothetical protein
VEHFGISIDAACEPPPDSNRRNRTLLFLRRSPSRVPRPPIHHRLSHADLRDCWSVGDHFSPLSCGSERRLVVDCSVDNRHRPHPYDCLFHFSCGATTPCATGVRPLLRLRRVKARCCDPHPHNATLLTGGAKRPLNQNRRNRTFFVFKKESVPCFPILPSSQLGPR